MYCSLYIILFCLYEDFFLYGLALTTQGNWNENEDDIETCLRWTQRGTYNITWFFIDIMRSAHIYKRVPFWFLCLAASRFSICYYIEIHVSVQIYAKIIDNFFGVSMPFFFAFFLIPSIYSLGWACMRKSLQMDFLCFSKFLFPFWLNSNRFLRYNLDIILRTFFLLWSISLIQTLRIYFDELMYYAVLRV